MKEFKAGKTYRLKKKYWAEAAEDTSEKYKRDYYSAWWKHKPINTEFTVSEIKDRMVVVVTAGTRYVPVFTHHRKYYKEVKK